MTGKGWQIGNDLSPGCNRERRQQSSLDRMNEDDVRTFLAKAEVILRAYRGLAGSVLYSNKSTLKRGSILFYGINPGYDQVAKHRVCWKIDDALSEFATGFPVLASEPNKDINPIPAAQRLHKDRNLIDDQEWPNVEADGRLEDGPGVGRAKYQINARSLLKLLPPHLDVVVGNWFFLQTRKAEEIEPELERRGFDYAQFLDDCWRVQRVIFEITRPPLLITCEGVLGPARLRSKLKLRKCGERIFSGHVYRGHQTYCERFIGRWLDESGKEKKIHVCKMPHSSWYNIEAQDNAKEVREWFAKFVEAALRDGLTNTDIEPSGCHR